MCSALGATRRTHAKTALGIAALLLAAAVTTGIPEPGSPVPAIAWGIAALISGTGAIIFSLKSSGHSISSGATAGDRETAARWQRSRNS